jgi:aspartate/tyrosine/aromatic aminotransferase
MDLYKERVGALMIVNHSHTVEAMQSTIKQIIRRNYSNPPAHGALVVETILSDSKRKKLWLDELEEHRLRSVEMRALIFNELESWIRHKKEFQEAKGFFSYLGISKEMVLKLREESIYLLDDSRLNVLGVNGSNIDRLKEVFSRLKHG